MPSTLSGINLLLLIVCINSVSFICSSTFKAPCKLFCVLTADQHLWCQEGTAPHWALFLEAFSTCRFLVGTRWSTDLTGTWHWDTGFYFSFSLLAEHSDGYGLWKLPSVYCWGGWKILLLKGRVIGNFLFWISGSFCSHLVFQNLSTSPLAEPPHFVSHIRSTLTFLKEHPFPSRSLFPDRKPRIYRKNQDGLWEQVCSDKI